MSEITDYQISIMRHTVGIGRGENRNFFGTGLATQDSIEFEKLVALGLATSETPPTWSGDRVVYRLTAKGREALKK